MTRVLGRQLSAGDPDDVLRSLRRYVSLTLGSPPWTVRLQRTRVADDQRPVAILEPGTLGVLRARATVPQGDVQYRQPFTIVCYPQLATTAAASAEAARQVATLLTAGITRGLVTDGSPPVDIGAPFRIPIYDFADVPIIGATRKGPDTPYSHANVDLTFNVRAVQDALDELRYTVVATVTLTWWGAGRIGPPAPLAAGGLAGSFAGEQR